MYFLMIYLSLLPGPSSEVSFLNLHYSSFYPICSWSFVQLHRVNEEPQKKIGLIVLMIFRRNTPILSFIIIIQSVTVSGPAGLFFCIYVI
jgi:hypothetical protein